MASYRHLILVNGRPCESQERRGQDSEYIDQQFRRHDALFGSTTLLNELLSADYIYYLRQVLVVPACPNSIVLQST